MRFDVYTDTKGEWRWRLSAANGEILAQSEGYKRRIDALHAIDVIREKAPDAEIVREA